VELILRSPKAAQAPKPAQLRHRRLLHRHIRRIDAQITRCTNASFSPAALSGMTNAPEFGWVDADPPNGLMPRDEHIAIADWRDYDDVCPISGILRGGSEHYAFVDVPQG
jgi:hypothetical protein